MDETDEIMTKHEGIIQGLKENSRGKVVVMGRPTLQTQDIIEAADKRELRSTGD